MTRNPRPEIRNLRPEKQMAKKYFLEAEIIENRRMSESWHSLRIDCPEIAAAAEPGQFVQLRAWDGAAPLLCRPISIAGAAGGREILLWIKKVGEGTRLITERPAGESLNVTGPLGRGFGRPAPGEAVYFVGGSVGAAPLRFAAERFGVSDGSVFFHGCGNACETGALSDSMIAGMEVVLTTDDGSAGEKGLVTDPLGRRIAEKKPDRILACGPMPMLKAAAAIAAREVVRCEVSLESYMSCGFGACMGCVVPAAENVKQGQYFHVCTDGPVFDSKLIGWEAF